MADTLRLPYRTASFDAGAPVLRLPCARGVRHVWTRLAQLVWRSWCFAAGWRSCGQRLAASRPASHSVSCAVLCARLRVL